jgi:hypothetical protein
MTTASGKYRVDDAFAAFLGTPLLRLLQSGDTVHGRYGRRGVISGRLKHRTFVGEWRDHDRNGWLRLRFDTSFDSCEGEYGLLNDEPVMLGKLHGSRVVRKRPQTKRLSSAS